MDTAIGNTINDMLGEVASDMGVDAAMSAGVGGGAQKMGEDAGAAIVNNASAAMSHLMAAYTAYVVAVMVVQMLYECEEDELALETRRHSINTSSMVPSLVRPSVLLPTIGLAGLPTRRTSEFNSKSIFWHDDFL
ncbi:MAG: hypothetical protein JAZ02_18280 [Candidatus Thiodiazotropha endolucinida]|nr:hypothetical protein [Candidatus Thiodiazotropha endolucinida]